jgi:hypothetical protein
MISDQNKRERSLCSKASQCFVDTEIVNHKPTNLLGLDINEDESASSEQSAQQYRILVIDDEPDVALSLKAGLEHEQEEKEGIGFAVYTFNDSTEALSNSFMSSSPSIPENVLRALSLTLLGSSIWMHFSRKSNTFSSLSF